MSSIRKIDLSAYEQEVKELTGYDIDKRATLDLSKTIENQPVALAIGNYQYEGRLIPVPFGSYGDFSCIVGPSKSMKTFFKSALLAAYVGGYKGNSRDYFSEIYGFSSQGKWVVDIDTEQNPYHSMKSARRTLKMIGEDYDRYKMVVLRDYTPKERRVYLKWLFEESEFRKELGLVSVDGIADLINNINDLDESNSLITDLMRWTKQTGCHMITVLHQNFGSVKPTGHLGSAMIKKAETTVSLDRNKESGTVKVKPEYCRNYPFDEFEFEVGDDFLPRERVIASSMINKDVTPF